MKKCPGCGSSRFNQRDGEMHCKRCGYIHSDKRKANITWQAKQEN